MPKFLMSSSSESDEEDLCVNSRAEEAYRKKVSESDKFDVDDSLIRFGARWIGLRGERFAKREDYDPKIELFARIGIHKYNMFHGTNFKLCRLEKYNYHPSMMRRKNHISFDAKDPAVCGGSPVPFQTRIYEYGRRIKNRIMCDIARPKPGALSEEENPSPTLQEPEDNKNYGPDPQWPSENAFDDEKRFYVMKDSEVQEHDWVRLYLELAFLKWYDDGIDSPNLSKLVIERVVVEWKEEDDAKLPLIARDATFYIRYKYKRLGSQRLATVKKTVTGIRLALIFHSWFAAP